MRACSTWCWRRSAWGDDRPDDCPDDPPVIGVRAARPGDAAAVAAIYAPHVQGGGTTFETEAPDAATMAGRMAEAAPLHPWLVAEEAGELLGYAHASQFSPRAAYRWAAETTIYVADAGQRRGVGRRLYGALLARLGAQGFTQAIGRIALPNPPSVTLHRRLGFHEAGVLREIGWKAGRWIDVGYWQCSLGEASDQPDEPRPFAGRADQR